MNLILRRLSSTTSSKAGFQTEMLKVTSEGVQDASLLTWASHSLLNHNPPFFIISLIKVISFKEELFLGLYSQSLNDWAVVNTKVKECPSWFSQLMPCEKMGPQGRFTVFKKKLEILILKQNLVTFF